MWGKRGGACAWYDGSGGHARWCRSAKRALGSLTQNWLLSCRAGHPCRRSSPSGPLSTTTLHAIPSPPPKTPQRRPRVVRFYEYVQSACSSRSRVVVVPRAQYWTNWGGAIWNQSSSCEAEWPGPKTPLPPRRGQHPRHGRGPMQGRGCWNATPVGCQVVPRGFRRRRRMVLVSPGVPATDYTSTYRRDGCTGPRGGGSVKRM